MKTDKQLKLDVEQELEWDPAVNAAGIGVEVHDRVVTLAGHLASYAEKISAEKAAQRVEGVKAVVVELDVRVPHGDTRTDEEIASSVRSVLLWTVAVPESALKVRVEKGVVTLSGEVEWGYQSSAAEDAVFRLRGVIAVINNISVHTRVVPGDIAAKIEDALKRHAEQEAKHIQVSVSDGTVTLSGKVNTFSDKAIARNAAWSAPGVRQVVERLSVGS
ncbi:BON domain-containing protein [Paraburkholderia sp. RL17-373-BIF-A]|uniref:BON domain-containing protein n=1 Tax=Paraburkholderia sp. RL17-373-BIF-A TaxID=3031629 RepID=UPI0038BA2782